MRTIADYLKKDQPFRKILLDSIKEDPDFKGERGESGKDALLTKDHIKEIVHQLAKDEAFKDHLAADQRFKGEKGENAVITISHILSIAKKIIQDKNLQYIPVEKDLHFRLMMIPGFPSSKCVMINVSVIGNRNKKNGRSCSAGNFLNLVSKRFGRGAYCRSKIFI